MEGGTTFYFVTDGISALDQAKKAARTKMLDWEVESKQFVNTLKRD